MSGGQLNLSERDAGIEGGHDERGPEHMRMNQPYPSTLPDRANPAVRGAPVEAAAVVAHQDRSVSAFADSEIDGSGSAGHQRNEGRLVSLADDSQHPVASLEGHVLDVGVAGLADTQAV